MPKNPDKEERASNSTWLTPIAKTQSNFSNDDHCLFSYLISYF